MDVLSVLKNMDLPAQIELVADYRLYIFVCQ